ncbi:MAG: hypothetical protein AAFP97_03070 [Pseudomonadota bacterium]
MRLAILAISAAAISGCSWGGSYKAPTQPGCYPAYGHSYGGYTQGYQQIYQYGHGYALPPGCVSGTYGVHSAGGLNPAGGFQSAGFAGAGFQGAGFQGAGFTGNGYGFQNYGGATGFNPAGQGMIQPGVGFQAGSTYVASGYPAGQFAGAGGFGGAGAFAGQGVVPSMGQGGFAGNATTLGATAPFGSALSSNFVSSGQFGAAPGVQTIVGAPIYAPQPFPAPYPFPVTGGPACCGVGGAGGFAGGGGAMRFGVEAFAGTEFDVSGDIFTKKSDGPPDGDYSIPIRVGEIEPISYKDAFGAANTIGGALAYDVSPNTTLLASVGYSEAEGQTVENYTTVQDGTWASQVFTPAVGSSPRYLDGEFTDLKTTTIEAGLRQYSGNPHGLRGYVGVSGGFAHNNDVTFTQTFADTGAYYGERTFIDSGWNPTAAAVIGAELPVGPRAAIGAEWGVRWRDSMNTTAPSEDRITTPLAIRGRLAF